MESKHMQTPWETTNNMFGVGNMRVWGIIQKDKDIERPVANCGTDGKTDAEFIVTACNAHADLVKALGMLLKVSVPEPRAALAKAKGEQS